jgi:phage shock protein PspC (stress-responsive transcriptional regulator)
MHKVISISLNGIAYQLDEAGYETLREYLARAEQQLKDNPDRPEIMSDLEQAIADKCQTVLGPHKTVVAAADINRIVAEMGPVDSAGGDQAEAASGPAAAAPQAPPKRLYRIPAGAMIAGVCTGIAAYLQVDITIVRIAFVIAALLTKGLGIIAYIVMMFVIPEASSPEEAAGGAPLNAKDVIDRARRRSAETTREWRRKWRHQQREWRRQWPAGAPLAYAPPPLVAALASVFGLVHIALFLVMVAMMISLVNTGAILDWHLPPQIPVWGGALILLVAYQFVVSPIRAAQQWSWYPGSGAQAAPFAFWNAVVWLVGIAFAVWLASEHLPEIREFLHRLPDLLRDFGRALSDLTTREPALLER